jgi:hypothetical protein
VRWCNIQEGDRTTEVVVLADQKQMGSKVESLDSGLALLPLFMQSISLGLLILKNGTQNNELQRCSHPNIIIAKITSNKASKIVQFLVHKMLTMEDT